MTYQFAPSTCTITETDFIASGAGEVDGKPFWVSASADRVNLVVGEETEVEMPDDDDQVWLTSVAGVSWVAADQGLDGSTVMRDERDTTARDYQGMLSIECPSN